MAVTLFALTVSVILWSFAAFSREMRVAEATSGLSARARTIADRIDDQCKERADGLRSAAAGYRLADRLKTGDIGPIKAAVREMSGALPDISALAVYTADGRAIAGFPPGPLPKRRGGATAWFLDRSLQPEPIIVEAAQSSAPRPTRYLALAISLGPEARPNGYLVSFFKTDFVRRMLTDRGPQDCVGLSIHDQHGGVVADVPARRGAHAETGRSRTSNRSTVAVADSSAGTISVSSQARSSGLVVEAEMDSSAVPGAALLLLGPQACIMLACFGVALLAVWHYPDLYQRHEVMRDTLTIQNRELKELDHAKSEFLANVSHDLWTPLASLEMSLSGLLDTRIQWRPEQVRERLHLASHELSQLINRVRNLLEMARLNANADMGQKEPCDLTDIVGSALERLSPLLSDRDVAMHFPAYPLMFMGRHSQFEIVFMNLVENAIKYTPPGSPLTIHGERRATDIYVTVRDCGSGVEPHEADLIFQQFYRSDRTKSRSGSGLGLAICKAIVELHGGVIGVRSPHGGGAEFWLSVPSMPKDKLD